MSKDIEIVIRDADNVSELARVEQGYVTDDHVAMALVRAVNGACVQLGIEPPGPLFAQSGSAETAALREAVGTLTEQSAMITQALAEAGFPGRVDTGSMLTAIADMRQQARVAGALGADFESSLRAAREAYPLAMAVGNALDARESPGQPKVLEHSQIAALRGAASALGELLFALRGINPEPVRNGDGSTTVTLTEAVTIGTPATEPEATP